MKIWYFKKKLKIVLISLSNRSAHFLPFLLSFETLSASELVAERERDAMERLLQPSSSSTISTSKFPLRTCHFCPRLRSSSLGFVSSHRPESRRVSSISCNMFQKPWASTPIESIKTNNSSNGSAQLSPETEELKPNLGFLQRIVSTASEQRKVFNFTFLIFGDYVFNIKRLLSDPIHIHFPRYLALVRFEIWGL